jgi:predicted nucleic acid-binding protein
MEVAFLDTSALLKLFFTEIGSTWLANFVKTRQIAVSELVLFEATVSIRRKLVSGTLTKLEAYAAINKINIASGVYTIVPLGGKTLLDAVEDVIFQLPDTLVIRSLDAIHLASAVQIFDNAKLLTPPKPFVFVSSDAQLLRVAQAQKLLTENPEDHP